MKITKKDLKNRYWHIIKTGYCDLQDLIRANYKYIYEFGSASGVYGWNWTAYEFFTKKGYRVAICTGYRDLVGVNIDDFIIKYQDRAKKYSMILPFGGQAKAQKRNIGNFINSIDKLIQRGILWTTKHKST